MKKTVGRGNKLSKKIVNGKFYFETKTYILCE